SKSIRLIEVVLPRGIHTTRSRRAPAERPGYDRGKSPANPTDGSVSRGGRGYARRGSPSTTPPTLPVPTTSTFISAAGSASHPRETGGGPPPRARRRGRAR